MPDYYSNMSTTLDNLKTVVLKYQNTTLSTVKTYKRGVLPPIPVYPAIAILPVNEEFGIPRSGGIIPVKRNIVIEVYIKHLKESTRVSNCNTITDEIVDILKTEHQLDDSGKAAWDTQVSNVTYGDSPYKNDILRRGTVQLQTKSFQTLPSNYETVAISDKDQSDIITAIYDYINGYSFTDTIRTIKKGIIPPTPAFPAIYVTDNTETHMRYETGADDPRRVFSVTTFVKQLDKEAMLNSLLRVTEDLKTLLWTNQRLANKAKNSYITGVEYGSYIAQNNALYSSEIMFEVECRDLIDS